MSGIRPCGSSWRPLVSRVLLGTSTDGFIRELIEQLWSVQDSYSQSPWVTLDVAEDAGGTLTLRHSIENSISIDCYKVRNISLKVALHVDEQTVRRAYRRLALKHHPDHSEASDAAVKFIAINEAYSLLMGRSRGKSDSHHHSHSAGWDFHDWYWSFMTRQRKTAQCGKAAAPTHTLDESHLQSQLVGLKRKAAARRTKMRGTHSASQAGPQTTAQQHTVTSPGLSKEVTNMEEGSHGSERESQQGRESRGNKHSGDLENQSWRQENGKGPIAQYSVKDTQGHERFPFAPDADGGSGQSANSRDNASGAPHKTWQNGNTSRKAETEMGDDMDDGEGGPHRNGHTFSGTNHWSAEAPGSMNLQSQLAGLKRRAARARVRK